MALILSVETSGLACSVAIYNESRLVASAQVNEPKSHAAQLAVLIHAVLKKAAISINHLNAVAVSSGPGSYTGLRIGVSTAKGLCYGLGIPLIAVSTLDILAFQVKTYAGNHQLLCPMIDARRMEVYCKIIDSNWQELKQASAVIVNEESFLDQLKNHQIFFFGDGASKCKEIIKHKNALFIDDVSPQATAMGLLAIRRFEELQFEDIVNFEPVYLKDFDSQKHAV